MRAYAVVGGCSADPSALAPVCYTHGYAVNGHDVVRAAVALLLLSSRPLAVFFAVVAVVVDAIERMSFWSREHVFDKLKFAVPRIANGYPSTSVILIMLVRWVIASRHHAIPNSVGRPCHLGVLAADNARFAVRSGRYGMDNGDVAAITPTLPSFRCVTDSSPVAKPLSGQIYLWAELLCWLAKFAVACGLAIWVEARTQVASVENLLVSALATAQPSPAPNKLTNGPSPKSLSFDVYKILALPSKWLSAFDHCSHSICESKTSLYQKRDVRWLS